MKDLSNNVLYSNIREILTAARQHICSTVNSTMVQTYWHIGQLIVEDEQNGEKRAEYGKQLLKQLSLKLSEEFGRGFDVRNLRYMRLFYQTFPIRNAVRSELSWTHYRTLLSIEDTRARAWYMQEAIDQNWSTRALERQINVFYYEHLLSSKENTLENDFGQGLIGNLQQHLHRLINREVYS